MVSDRKLCLSRAGDATDGDGTDAPLAATAREGLERSKEELDRRCRDQRFLADRALNLKQWEEAKSALMVLMEMVPDRRDDRHRDAKTKLLSAESHLKKGGER